MRRSVRNEATGIPPDKEAFSVKFSNEPEPALKKKKKPRGFFQEYLIDFSANSSLHGLRYIGEAKRKLPERLFWGFMFTVSTILCAILIRKVWLKWDENPVIVSFAENSTPVWKIPFPAITICSETKSRQTVFNWTEAYHLNAAGNLTGENATIFHDISLVCDAHLDHRGNKYTNMSTVENIKMVAPDFKEMMFLCKWKDISGNCTHLFTPILTEEGVCYTFNTLSAAELFREENIQKDYPYLVHSNQSEGWTLENGYPEGIAIETYPHRGTGYGARAGLVILMRAYKYDLDYLCRGPVQGFKVLLHNPAEVPRLSQQYFRVPLSQEMVAAIKPNMMTTSPGLRSYDPVRRQCYFPSERYLKYFQVYTQINCELECLANFTRARCGCIPFSMPHNNEADICSSGSTGCVTNAQNELVTHEIIAGLGDKSVDDKAEKIASECKCLPACTSIEYDAETSQADFDWQALYQSFNLKADEPQTRMSRVMIFFKEAQFITSRRSELYGQTDFLANCGGLLGLFMGFSILSLAEIIYFLTLRLYYIFQKGTRKDTSSDSPTLSIKRKESSE